MVDKLEQDRIVVVDIGARYGIHPTWKRFPYPVTYHLVDPDPIESTRLRARYAGNTNVIIHEVAILNYTGKSKLHIRENPAMSGTEFREDISPLYWENTRRNQLNIELTQEVDCLTLKDFRDKTGRINFLKIDTEGTEFEILEEYTYFNEIVGIRSEVCFDRLFRNLKKDTFSDLNSKLLDNGFILLNIDYLGQGDFYSSFISSRQRYGILQATDAVWIKNPYKLIQSKDFRIIAQCSLFCFFNNAPDVALWIIEKTYETIKDHLNHDLIRQLKYAVVRHLYDIKWDPGQNITKHKEFFESIFQEDYPSAEKFNESSIFNPVELIL